jgi:ABC-type nitrate/sulfonate/bicarbonate transport system substrate-binding protein
MFLQPRARPDTVKEFGSMPIGKINRRTVLAFGAVGAATLVAGGPLLTKRIPAIKVKVADAPQIMSTLLYVALDQGYLSEEGIEIELTKASSSKEALALVIDGKVDICTVAETPVMLSITDGEPVQVFATIGAGERDTAIAVPTESAIRDIADLRDKRIGIVPGTSSSYFAQILLAAAGIPISAVTLVELSAEDAHLALASNAVDALSARWVMRQRSEASLGRPVRSIYADGLYLETWNLASRRAYLVDHGEAARRILRALIRAHDLTATSPDRAIEIVAHRVAIDRKSIAAIWDDYYFDVTLDQSLLVNLEGQWRLTSAGEARSAMPNFLDGLDPTILHAVAPGRVTFIRPMT